MSVRTERQLVALVGVSGVGKTTLMRMIAEHFPLNCRIVRATLSRSLRDEWEESVLDSMSAGQLQKLWQAGELVHHQVIYGNTYALTRKNADLATATHLGLICLDHEGANQIRGHGYDVRAVVVTSNRAIDARSESRLQADLARQKHDLVKPHDLHLHNQEGRLAATFEELRHYIVNFRRAS